MTKGRTTSRGKAHPSPDEFASYISSSPPKAHESDKRVVVSFNSSSSSGNNNSSSSKAGVFDDSSDDDDDSGIVFAEWRRDDDEGEEEENSPKEGSEGLGGTLSVEQLNALRGRRGGEASPQALFKLATALHRRRASRDDLEQAEQLYEPLMAPDGLC